MGTRVPKPTVSCGYIRHLMHYISHTSDTWQVVSWVTRPSPSVELCTFDKVFGEFFDI